MSNVVDLAAEREARQPHLAGRVRCLACGHEHTSVCAVGVAEQECPACGLMRGVWMDPLLPVEGSRIWTCACEGQLFLLCSDAPMCARCGATQVWEPER